MPSHHQGTAAPLFATTTDLEELLGTSSRAARDAARWIDGTSLQRKATPIRKTFVRRSEADVALDPSGLAPLLTLYRGGRSGVVPIRLYLALVWLSSAAPYKTDKVARGWATLLDLADPAGKGARRVRDALDSLERARLVTLEPRPGDAPIVTLLREDASGTRYVPPGEAYFKAQKNKRGEDVIARHRYFKVNNALWTSGRLQRLSGPALVMLLILLAEQGGTGKEVWFSTSAFADWYPISSATRAAGVKELQDQGLLKVDHRGLPDYPGAPVFARQRKRHVYTLQGLALDPDPAPATS